MTLDHSPKDVSVAAGTIDEVESQIPLPSDHIFLQYKAPWCELPESDKANRWEEWDP